MRFKPTASRASSGWTKFRHVAVVVTVGNAREGRGQILKRAQGTTDGSAGQHHGQRRKAAQDKQRIAGFAPNLADFVDRIGAQYDGGAIIAGTRDGEALHDRVGSDQSNEPPRDRMRRKEQS